MGKVPKPLHQWWEPSEPKSVFDGMRDHTEIEGVEYFFSEPFDPRAEIPQTPQVVIPRVDIYLDDLVRDRDNFIREIFRIPNSFVVDPRERFLRIRTDELNYPEVRRLLEDHKVRFKKADYEGPSYYKERGLYDPTWIDEPQTPLWISPGRLVTLYEEPEPRWTFIQQAERIPGTFILDPEERFLRIRTDELHFYELKLLLNKYRVRDFKVVESPREIDKALIELNIVARELESEGL